MYYLFVSYYFFAITRLRIVTIKNLFILLRTKLNCPLERQPLVEPEIIFNGPFLALLFRLKLTDL